MFNFQFLLFYFFLSFSARKFRYNNLGLGLGSFTSIIVEDKYRIGWKKILRSENKNSAQGYIRVKNDAEWYDYVSIFWGFCHILAQTHIEKQFWYHIIEQKIIYKLSLFPFDLAHCKKKLWSKYNYWANSQYFGLNFFGVGQFGRAYVRCYLVLWFGQFYGNFLKLFSWFFATLHRLAVGTMTIGWEWNAGTPRPHQQIS